MRIQTDGTSTLEARECRVMTEAAAIAMHISRLCDDAEKAANIRLAADTFLALVVAHRKPAPETPTPEPPETGKAKKGATDAA